VALRFPREYYAHTAAMYQAKRDLLLDLLRRAGFQCLTPYGAYYIMAGIALLTSMDDTAFSEMLVRDVGVASVPGGSFFHDPSMGRGYVRFAYPKREETLAEVGRRLSRLAVTR